ncbi:MAG: NYN domain-containing protein, partial [Miltoncostaeaceae bacterium]
MPAQMMRRPTERSPLAEGESSLAVLVDYENMARPGAKGRADFDIHAVLDRLSDKGRVIVKRAYADWSRYRDARHELQNAGLGLIEMPSAREGAKNRADIQLVVDAMELAYSRTHVDDFVVVSGDFDFTPLVGKLRELGKRVIGVGNRDSASELLIANCDEFIFYDSIATRGRSARPSGGKVGDPDQLMRDTLAALSGDGTDWPLASVLKDSMRRKAPAFDQSDLGFSTFSRLLEDAAKRGVLKIETDPRSGTYRVALPDDAPLPDEAPVQKDKDRDKDEGGASSEGGGGRRRRRGRGRRGGGGGGGSTQTQEAENVVSDGAEVFEVVVTPEITESAAAELPPIDQPIS